MKYISKRVTIEAEAWNPNLDADVQPDLIRDVLKKRNSRIFGNKLIIETYEGVMAAFPGDYIIRGTEGEYYPCKPSVFKRKYELATDTLRDEFMNAREKQND